MTSSEEGSGSTGGTIADVNKDFVIPPKTYLAISPTRIFSIFFNIFHKFLFILSDERFRWILEIYQHVVYVPSYISDVFSVLVEVLVSETGSLSVGG
jgi:hypothetical protein